MLLTWPQLPLHQPAQIRFRRQQRINQLAVLAWMHRAGGVHQLSARPQQRQQAIQQLAL
jgi:hypothetical protein